jgi:hypothetical protein
METIMVIGRMPEASHVYRNDMDNMTFYPGRGRTTVEERRFYKHTNPLGLYFMNSVKTNIDAGGITCL